MMQGHITHNLMNGAWVNAHSGETIPVDNPSTGAVIGTVPNLSREEVIEAVMAAHHAQPAWAARTAYERAAILLKWQDLILTHKERLAVIMTNENGKPIGESRTEIDGCARAAGWFGGEIKRSYGRIVPSNIPNRQIQVIKQPVGVSGLITPWNFPGNMLMRKMAPALAAGCAVVAKPDHRTPFTALALAELGMQAGLPDGVLNVVTGDASMIGQVFCMHPLVRKISFTGSTTVGKILSQQAAPYLKKLSLELGGNAPFIIFESFDIEEAIEKLLEAKIRNTGQTCVSANRVYVHDSLHDAFVSQLADTLKKIKMGDGHHEDVRLGPLIDENAVTKVSLMVQEAISSGAKCLLGGRKSSLGESFYELTLLTGVKSSMRVACEEIFGPVIAVQKFKTEAEVVQAANNTDYGLIAYMMTHDLSQAHRVAAALESGMVAVNNGMASFTASPFGGVKYSGQGRESGREGLEAFQEIKAITIQL